MTDLQRQMDQMIRLYLNGAVQFDAASRGIAQMREILSAGVAGELRPVLGASGPALMRALAGVRRGASGLADQISALEDVLWAHGLEGDEPAPAPPGCEEDPEDDSEVG